MAIDRRDNRGIGRNRRAASGGAGGGRKKPAPPLNETRLRDLALHYLSRYATSRLKLARYLTRKLRERGWEDERPADVEALLDRMEALKYLDDAGYAAMRGASLSRRGYGKRRIEEDLRAGGIEAETVAELVSPDEPEGVAGWGMTPVEAPIDHVAAALKLARRRKLGPFGAGGGDEKARNRAIAILVRAGHSFALSRHIVDQPVGSSPEVIAEEAPPE